MEKRITTTLLSGNEISSITNGPRQTNFELLRLVAMFMVLCLHANYKTFGIPLLSEESNVFNLAFRVFAESFCIVAVNIFVLISGWFLIKATKRGFFTFVFQCLFFLVGTYIFFVATGQTEFSFHGILSCLCLNHNGWFIICYIGLYALSPILNRFIETSSKRHLELVLISFALYSFFFGWVGNVGNFNKGYSTLSFICLYLIGYYCHAYVQKCYKWGRALILIVLLNSALNIASVVFIHGEGSWRLLHYLNPLVIIQSVCFVMWFSQIKIRHNKVINYIAKSAFAVYLIHDISSYQEHFYRYIIEQAFIEGGIVFIILAIALFFISGLMIDQPRRWLWGIIVKHNFDCINHLLIKLYRS